MWYLIYRTRFWNRKISPEVGLRGRQNIFKEPFFLEIIFMSKLWDTRGSSSDSLKPCQHFIKFEFFKSYHDKIPSLSITKVLL